MAEINNKNGTRELATDEAGMMTDAKAYAKADYHIIKSYKEQELGRELSIDEENEVAKTLIDAKYKAIKKSRHGVNANFL